MTIAMSVATAARLVGGRVHGAEAPEGVRFVGLSTDSRTVCPGELFVALKGPNFDGHAFVGLAAEKGAAAALVSAPVAIPLPQLVVGDTIWSLAHLAMLWRSRFTMPVVALTGSNGKTTVKEMLRAIMVAHVGDAHAVLATEGNLNNNIGLPLMLARMGHAHRIAVLEMGMNHLEEIDYLTRLAVPDVALIIMAGTAHIGEVGSREAIAQAKGEIFHGLRHDGVACINLDDRFAGYWRTVLGTHSNRRRVVTFGTHRDAVVRGTLDRAGITLAVAAEEVHVPLNVVGEHNQRNAMAAAAAAHAAGVPLAAIAAGLSRFEGVAGRLRALAGHNAATIIDDTYNANPDSMRAAIDVLAARTDKRILVMGDMGELGQDAAAMHADIGAYAKTRGLPMLLGLGEHTREAVMRFGAGAQHFENVEALISALIPLLSADTTVLVKGSRFMRMERVVAAIAAPGAFPQSAQKGSH
jgi:UDP-N-acetylmuramoyl-tripeptide--D-alanyl-D-alanine ligase